MGTLIIQSQLGALENGLKDLKKSRLMQIREFKDMYSAIESHHRDLRLAHLTGMAKDIMVQAEQDTRFFHILIKMMCEVKHTSSVKQKDSLIKVHHWYTSNRHILHTRPRFGRQKKDSASTKTSTPATSHSKTASAKRIKNSSNNPTIKQQTQPEQPTVRLASADGSKNRIFCETPSARTESPFKTAFDLDLLPSNQDYVNDYLSTNYYSEGNNKMASLQNFLNDLPGPPSRMSDFHTGSHVTGHQHVEIKKPGSLEDSGGTPPGSPREDIDGSAVSPDYIDSLIDYSHKVDDAEDEDDPDFEVEVTIGGEDSDMPESRRKLSRGRTPSASLHREQVLSDQSSNISIALPKKMIHPIASLVNPHATLAAAEARRAEEEYLNSRQDVYTPLRPSRYPSAQMRSHMTTPVAGRPLSNTRAESLNQWKNFNKDFSYGQDILGKLNFVGRSGTALDVRYSSHGSGEAPEKDTSGILAYFATESHPMVMQSPIQVDTENRLLNRPLEEFYQMADEYYPPKPPKYHHPVVAKPNPPKQAPPTSARSESTSKSAKIQPLGKNLLENDEKSEEKDNMSSDVKLDAVVNMIDAVSGDMLYFKERLAPQPIAGFRQPASHGVSMKPLSRPATATGVRSQSPVMRTNTPVGNHGNLSRSLSNPYISQDILIGEESVNPRSARSMPSSRMAQAIDWRGKIAPDSVRSKWKNKQFGEHTFVKRMARGRRPVGATHAGSRPKTAPVTAREKWKTDKPSDQNTRVEGQAATNTMTQVDQNAVDSMMQVQHILGSSDSRAGSFNSLYMDENFLRSLNSRMTSVGGSTNTNTPIPMEYVPIVANAPRSLPESRSHSRLTKKSEHSESRIQEYQYYYTPRKYFRLYRIKPEDDVDEKHLEVDEAYSQKGVVTTTPIDPVLGQAKTPEGEREPVNDKNDEDLESESRDQVSELPGESIQGDNADKGGEDHSEAGEGDSKAQQKHEDSAPTYREPVHFSEELHNGDVHLEVLAIPSGGRNTSPPRVKHGTVQELSTSDSWNFSPIEEDVKERRNISTPKFQVRGEHWLKNLVKPENYCFECIPESMSTKVGRQAGRMPNRTQSASSQVLRMSRKQTEYFKKAPPLRTPPSIPTVPHRQPMTSDQSPRYGQTYNPELDHHARSTRSPRHFMEHVVDLRANGIRSAPPGSNWGLEGGLSSSLTVSGLTSRQNTTIMRPGIQHERTMYPNSSHIETLSDGTKHVVFDDEVTESSQRLNGTEEPMDSSTGDQDRFKSGTTMKSRKSNQSIAHVGRPIAHYHNIKDPHETEAAFKVQKEAQAAVDIQRIFRGYVARNMYKKLIKDEREKMEDQQKAAVEIQRVYRGHLIRKKAILNRPPVSKESLEWARELKIVQAEKAHKRQNKMEALANKNQLNQQTEAAKLSQIGPHVEIYQIYHPKHTGPTKKELYDAATSIQKNIRRFLVRCRFDRLQRKAIWYGSTWPKMVKDYKNSLKRCQQRHGVDRAKTPFTIEFMNDYMEARRRYESVFEKKAFAGEMEFEELDQFFRECDLYPSQSEIDEAVDVVFQGQASSRKGLRKNDVMELVWYIYTPKAAGLPNMRQSTWLNPIIDGVEARKLIGSEFVENAPLETCAKLVIDSKRERREKEQREKDKLEEEEAAKMKKELSEFQYDDDDENEGIKAELARTRERLSSCKSLEEGSKMSTTTN